MMNIANRSKYWNPFLERSSEEELQKIQLKKFKDIFEMAYKNSPSYRALYDANGLTPESIKSFDDIQKVPIIDKKFFDDNRECNSLYGNTLAVPEEDVVYYHQTSGTTHHPIRQPDTLDDWHWWAECWATLLWAQGVREKDRVLLPFNYNLFIAFWGAHYGFEKIGAEIISAGGLTTQQRLEKIIELNVTTIATTPTYAFRLIEKAEELNIDIRNSSVKRIICAGEPGALIEATKNELEDKWNCDVYDHVGATEVGAWGFECEEKCGGLHVNESMFLVELIDMESSEIITEPNKYGKVVITAFHRKGRPCIRFNTNDIACWQEYPCTCGRNYRILKGGVLGRIDHLIKVRGTFVTPAVIEEIIANDKRLSREYFIKVGEKNKDLQLVVEAKAGVSSSDFENIKKTLQAKIYNKIFLRFIIDVKSYGDLPRSEVKSKRFVDLGKEK